jgi:glyoxylase-like metal-dependent hydrolase (beta-lactamase superfamily II)
MSGLPEQPGDWTEPGAHPVADGVHRVPLPVPFDGLGAVNIYLVEGADGLIMIDGGWAMPDSERAMTAALRSIGHRPADVTEILVTHAHWDHYTQACAWRSMTGVPISVGRGERHTIDGLVYTDGRFPAQEPVLRRCGAGELAGRVATMGYTAAEREVPFGPPDRWLDDGDHIAVRRGKLAAVSTPGHTRGHMVFRNDTAGLLFAGDHVLPHITPSIGFEFTPEPFPLLSFLDSLRIVRDQPDALLLAAHGPVTRSAHTRVDELLAHHEQRLDAVVGQVRRGATTAFEVAAGLPWTRRERRLDQLDDVNQMLAVLEIDAHLDLLVGEGLLTRADIGGVSRYALS